MNTGITGMRLQGDEKKRKKAYKSHNDEKKRKKRKHHIAKEKIYRKFSYFPFYDL